VYNALDYVACVFPVTRVDPTLDTKAPPHQFFSERDENTYHLCECAPSLFAPQPLTYALFDIMMYSFMHLAAAYVYYPCRHPFTLSLFSRAPENR
jgi:hypothetical protein